MITGNMLVMFIIGFIIFCFYLFGLLYAIYWGHNSQKQDMLNVNVEVGLTIKKIANIKNKL